jgi:hypothetical protein
MGEGATPKRGPRQLPVNVHYEIKLVIAFKESSYLNHSVKAIFVKFI